jgi:hypothetical protein
MRDTSFADHMARLKSATIDGLTLAHVPEWIEKNTFLKGRPFSFQDHEFQLKVLQDPSREKVVRKCSQIGLSEMSARAALAITNILESSTIIYTMQTATFAKQFVTTRLNPIIAGSKVLRESIHPTVDNAEVKQFGTDSFLYIKGTVGTSAAISVPADGIFNDEVDFSDQEILSNYTSRLTHSKHRIRWQFSTPTVGGYGISSAFDMSRQHWNHVKCNHCNHWFVPDYFQHVIIPGWDKDIREIRKSNLHTTGYRDAYLQCPACKGKPSLAPEHREWVVKNPDDNFLASGFQIQPFDAPAIIAIPDLIKASTDYARYADFINFNLGLPADDSQSSFSRAELEALFVKQSPEGYWLNVMGLDMGMICTCVVGAVNAYGQLHVVHTEQIPIGRLEKRRAELNAEYRIGLTVMDSQPYGDTLMREQAKDPNLYGAVYTNSKDIQTFGVKKADADPEKGKPEVRQVNINRDKAFDGLMNIVRSNTLLIREDANKETIISHMMDMKRLKDFQSLEIAYTWRKSSTGEDHFHHAMLYMWIASMMRGVQTGGNAAIPLIGKFKHTEPSGIQLPNVVTSRGYQR